VSRPIRIAVQIPPAGAPDYGAWRDAVLQAEAAGVDAIFGYDHFEVPHVVGRDANGRPITSENPPVRTNFEAWTALASWAEITKRSEIGLLVGGAGFRNPDLLADMARTVDHISGGRLILGLGAGWYQPDYTEYGYDFGTVAQRQATFRDALERIEARFARLVPPPLRKIPILIGGSGEKKTLPAVARFADIWHSGVELDDFIHKSKILVEQAELLGRDASEIERAVSWVNADVASDYVDAGASMFTVQTFAAANGYDFSSLEDALEWRDAHG
jgi:probable F420-dependent oxidoreductase